MLITMESCWNRNSGKNTESLPATHSTQRLTIYSLFRITIFARLLRKLPCILFADSASRLRGSSTCQLSWQWACFLAFSIRSTPTNLQAGIQPSQSGTLLLTHTPTMTEQCHEPKSPVACFLTSKSTSATGLWPPLSDAGRRKPKTRSNFRLKTTGEDVRCFLPECSCSQPKHRKTFPEFEVATSTP